jgi:preprotein translocase subunit Sec61beta
MPTLTNADNDMPDIDPDSLTVNLTGGGPDEDDLVQAPKNVTMPEEIEEFGMEPSEESGYEKESDEKSEYELESSNPEAITSGRPANSDEAEIREIEELLRKKKSERIRTRNQPNKSSKKRKIDPIVIVTSVLAVAMAVLAVAYFAGWFNKDSSLGMTVDEFSKSYSNTTGYKAISKYGFAIPEMTFYDDEDTGATDIDPASVNYRKFSGYFDNSLKYQFAIQGVVNKSDSKITSLSSILILNTSKGFNDSLAVYAPILQVCYPELTIQQSIDLLNQLIASTTTATVKGNYALALVTSDSENPYYGELYIVSKDDVDTLNNMIATR